MMHEKDTVAHLSAAEPKLQQAVFGRDREIASPTSDTCLTSKRQKQKMTASSLLLFSPLSPLSISLPAHTTLFVTTPLLSSSTLFPCCHGDCKDTEISSLGSTKGLDLEFSSFLFILTTQQLCSFLSEVLWNHSIIQRNNKSKTNNGSSRMAPPSVQTGCEDG